VISLLDLYGKELFDQLSPEIAVQKCLRLKEMLDVKC